MVHCRRLFILISWCACYTQIWTTENKCVFFSAILHLTIFCPASSLLIYFIFWQVFVIAVLAVLPLVPKNLSNRAYRLSFMGTACSSLYSLYSLYGVSHVISLPSTLLEPYTNFPLVSRFFFCYMQRPRAWNMQGMQVYFQSIVGAKDFIYFIYCLTFVTSNLCLKCKSWFEFSFFFFGSNWVFLLL